MKIYNRVLIAMFCVAAWTASLQPNIPIAKQCRRFAPKITRRIAVSMELKLRLSDFAWTAQGKD